MAPAWEWILMHTYIQILPDVPYMRHSKLLCYSISYVHRTGIAMDQIDILEELPCFIDAFPLDDRVGDKVRNIANSPDQTLVMEGGPAEGNHTAIITKRTEMLAYPTLFPEKYNGIDAAIERFQHVLERHG